MASFVLPVPVAMATSIARRSAAERLSTAWMARAGRARSGKPNSKGWALQGSGGGVLIDLQLPASPPASASRPARGDGWRRGACRGTRCRSRSRSASGRTDHWRRRRRARDARPTVRRRIRNPLMAETRSSIAPPDRWPPRRSCAAAWPRQRRRAWCRRTGRSRQGRSRSAIRRSPCCGPWPGGRPGCSAGSWCRPPSRDPEAAGRSGRGSRPRRGRSWSRPPRRARPAR